MHPYVILDVFTDRPLEGNQVAVFTDGAEVPEEAMQRTAREMNLSETVFLLPGEDGADARIRIFTPTAELPFAGHPTLGTAYVVGERLGGRAVSLLTGAGLVRVEFERDGERIVAGEMEQPIPSVEALPRPDDVLRAVGVERSELPVEAYRNGPLHAYVMLPSFEVVAAVTPDFGALQRLGELGVSCFAYDRDGHVKTRMFAPGMGVAEDPATGSAAGPLALHLVRHGLLDYGRQVEIRQGEEIARPSLLRARVEGSGERVDRVLVGGSAVLVARGEYRLG